jgi:hypothetical protein
MSFLDFPLFSHRFPTGKLVGNLPIFPTSHYSYRGMGNGKLGWGGQKRPLRNKQVHLRPPKPRNQP